jgi:hypothetical protein
MKRVRPTYLIVLGSNRRGKSNDDAIVIRCHDFFASVAKVSIIIYNAES